MDQFTQLGCVIPHLWQHDFANKIILSLEFWSMNFSQLFPKSIKKEVFDFFFLCYERYYFGVQILDNHKLDIFCYVEPTGQYIRRRGKRGKI